ncbi:MAG: PepSY-associated TM helix domain-containing protein [Actinomycetales bacterium]
MTTTGASVSDSADPTSVPPPGETSGAGETTAAASQTSRPGLFAAFWRWHFYASLLVLPVMAVLAATGLIYLFRFTVDPWFAPGITVERPADDAAQMVPLARQQAAAEAAHPGADVTMVTEAAADRASVFSVALPDGEDRNVHVDPWSGEVTASVVPTSLPSDVAIRLHGELMAGRWGDYVIELAACWAIVMTLTGYYLFLRGRRARRARDRRHGRVVGLRSGHAVVGAVAGVGVLFLVASGLPWTAFWGDTVQQWAAPRGASLWSEDPGATSTLGERLEDASGSSASPGWAISAVPLAASTVPDGEGHDHGGAGSAPDGHPDDHRHHREVDEATPADSSVTVDTAVAAAVSEGLTGPFTITYPADETGVYSVLASQWYDPEQEAFRDVSAEATAHVDQYSGDVVARYGYADYTPAAQVVSQAIALHEGRRFGAVTTVTTTAFCLGILFLCVSAPVMWWRRRPKQGGLAAPRGRMPVRSTPWLAVGLVVLGVALPLFGLSLLVVLLLDQLVVRSVPALRRALSTT